MRLNRPTLALLALVAVTASLALPLIGADEKPAAAPAPPPSPPPPRAG